MNLDKIDTLLCFAFQHSDGPFKVLIKQNNFSEILYLNKEEISLISKELDVILISFAQDKLEKRWRQRTK